MLPIKHPKLQQLYDYWSAKRGKRTMPSRADIDPLEMTFIIGNLILVDVIPGTPLGFRIRLHGTNLVERAHYELTGKMLDDLPQVQFRDLTRQSFTKVAERNCITQPAVSLSIQKLEEELGTKLLERTTRKVLVTDQGRIQAEKIVICAGQWSRNIGKMAGVNVPLVSMQHQYLITDRIEGLYDEMRSGSPARLRMRRWPS